MNQRNQCFILKMCVTLAMESKGCASNNCGSIDLSSNGIIYTICRLCSDYSFMIPEWPLFWNEFIQSPYISLYLFTWYRKDIWSRTNHSGMSSFPVFAIIRHFVLVLCELKTNFENHASLNALGWAVRCYHVNAIWTSLSNETHSRMTFIPLSYKQPLTLVNSVCEKIENV